MHTSDYASRHPQLCTSDRCQICSFVHEWEMVGDRAGDIRHISIEDIITGHSAMPLTQRNSWKNIQKRDPTHSKLVELIKTQQLPESRKTNGIHTKLKLLHKQYTEGKLFIDNDGLVMLKTPEGYFGGAAISIPPPLFPGVASALHIQLQHPSRSQLSSLVSRYFYAPGWRAVIDDITNNCHQCAALSKLPKVLLQDSSQIPHGLATNFAADVIERNSQKILVVRENLSLYTRALIIKDQTADTLRVALLSLLTDIIPNSGAEIRVDNAPAFQTLERESNMPSSMFYKLKIKLVRGRLINKNKNPTVENANQEMQKEILKVTNRPGPISDTELQLVLRTINSRIRFNGLSSSEIMFRRNFINNEAVSITDQDLQQRLQNNRQQSSLSSQKHKLKTHARTPLQTFSIGDLVFLRGGKTKNTPRELYIVEDLQEEYYLLRKFHSRLREKLYKALPDEMIMAPTPASSPLAPTNNPVLNECDPPLLSKAGRPIRKAALGSYAKINTVNKSKKPPLRLGWNEEDQTYEEDDIPVLLNKPDVPSPASSRRPTDTSNPTDEEDSDSNPELSWDEDPQLVQLSPSLHPEDTSPNTSSDSDKQDKKLSNRRFATSEQVITRSDAFRCPPDTPPALPVRGSGSLPTLYFRRSRIPRPDSPSQMRLHEVNDISNLPLPPQSPPSNAGNSRNHRNVQQPSCYRRFNRSGKK